MTLDVDFYKESISFFCVCEDAIAEEQAYLKTFDDIPKA